MDSEVKAQMADICAQLGMSQSAAFNMFAKAFVRQKGMPFAVTLQSTDKAQIIADTETLLTEYAEDYQKMSE